MTLSGTLLLVAVLALCGCAKPTPSELSSSDLSASVAKLGDTNRTDRPQIAETIAVKLGESPSTDSGLVGSLIPFLKDKDDSVRYWMAIGIGKCGSTAKPAVPTLIEALAERLDTMASKDSSSGIRFALDRIEPNWRSRPRRSRGQV